MILNVLIAGVVLFFINSCIIPIHFVGYQFRSFKREEKLVFSKHMNELSAPQYLHYESKGCSYYFHRRTTHFIAVCQKDKDVYFVGTDVRSNDVHEESEEDVLSKLDDVVVARVKKIKTTISGLKPQISGPSFAVYKGYDLESEY